MKQSAGVGKTLYAGALLLCLGTVLRVDAAPPDSTASIQDEIARNMADAKVAKTFISPSTKEVGYAMYYKVVQKRIERMGTCNFPQKGDKKLYGNLIVNIPIAQDGTIFQRDGGVKIERSSGNPDLDKAAIDIVHMAAPFDKLSEAAFVPRKENVWVIITRFTFTRDDLDEKGVDCDPPPAQSAVGKPGRLRQIAANS